MLLGDLLDAAQALLKYGVQYIAPSLNDNLLKAVNALRCAVSNIGENTDLWKLVAAAYWAAVGFGQEKTLREYLDLGSKFAWTCREGVKNLLKAGAAAAPSCPGSKKSAAHQEKAREERMRIRANLQEYEDAAKTRMETRIRAELENHDHEAMERQEMDAFRRW